MRMDGESKIFMNSQFSKKDVAKSIVWIKETQKKKLLWTFKYFLKILDFCHWKVLSTFKMTFYKNLCRAVGSRFMAQNEK